MLLALWVFVLGGRDVTSECVFFTNLVDDEDLCFSMAEDMCDVRCVVSTGRSFIYLCIY